MVNHFISEEIITILFVLVTSYLLRFTYKEAQKQEQV